MNNIGQHLQEARSRLGYSIKEVSDIIHIRAEYIGFIEDNEFNKIPLDQVYVRGFVRLYSKFLKLDPDEMVKGYNKKNAQLEFNSEITEEHQSKSFGTYTAEKSDTETVEVEIANEERNPFKRYEEDSDFQRPPWLYPLAIASAVILAFAIIFVVKIIFFPTPVETAPSENAVSQVTNKDESGFSVESLNENLIGLVAKAPVYIYVTQTTDNEILFSGRLDANERKTLIRSGEISIACDKSENLIIEKGGIPIDLKGTTGKAQLLVD